MLLAVSDSADEQAYVPALQAAGYVLSIREPDWFEHRLFKGPDTNINLHVFTLGAAEQVKRDLAQRTWLHVQHYADSKTAIVQQIMARASAASQRDHPRDGWSCGC